MAARSAAVNLGALGSKGSRRCILKVWGLHCEESSEGPLLGVQHPPSRTDSPSEPRAGAAPPPALGWNQLSPRGGLRWGLLAHPAVQGLRFLNKALLATFLIQVDYGEAAYAMLVVLGAQIVAILGLDEALVYARRPGWKLWCQLRRVHHTSGLVFSAATFVLGLLLHRTLASEQLGDLLMALAPVVWLSNLSVLPRGLLVRHQEYLGLFRISLLQTLALFGVTAAMLALGSGPWALVGGLYANSIVSLISASIYSREQRRALAQISAEGDSLGETVAYGRPLTGTAFLTFLGDKGDTLALLPFLGARMVGIYEFAQFIALAAVTYCIDLAERCLFPALASHGRGRSLAPGFRGALRLLVLFFLPLHVMLAVTSRPLVEAVFPRWAGEDGVAIAILPLLCLAAGMRCIDVVATTGLKAAGEGALVLHLGGGKFALLVLALLLSMPYGLMPVAGAVLATRCLGAMASLWLAQMRITAREPAPHPRPSSGLLTFILWCLGFLGAAWWLEANVSAWWLEANEQVQALVLLLLELLAALVIWMGARLLSDRRAFLSESAYLRTRLLQFAGRQVP